MRIVDDDDVSWKVLPAEQEKEEEGDEADLPVVAEFIDERPDEVKWMEAFRASNKWKLLGDQNEELQSLELSVITSSSETLKQNTKKPLLAQTSLRRGCHSSPDQSPPRQGCPDPSPKRLPSAAGRKSVKSCSRGQRELLSSERSASRKKTAPDLLLPRNRTSGDEGDLWLPQKLQPSRTNDQLQPIASSPRKRQRHDSESSSDSAPLRRNTRAASDSDLSPPRASAHGGPQRPDSPSDLSPLRRNWHKSSDSDLSPPRRGPEGEGKDCRSRSPPNVLPRRQTSDITGVSQRMLSGGRAGLLSAESLRREKQDFKRQDGSRSQHLEAESQQARTVFRDAMGRKRDLKQERLDQARRAAEKAEQEEQFAKWGRGLAQSRQQQQNVEDAVKEMQKPLARYIHDQDLDQMLREQERDGDPMADFLKKKKAASQAAKEKPKYKGPAPPLNRFNIWPGYRWDGVDRSNGFEQKRFARIASRKAVQELAYKWSVEDM